MKRQKPKNRALFKHEGVEYLVTLPNNCAECSVKKWCYAADDDTLDLTKGRAHYCNLKDVGRGLDITHAVGSGKEFFDNIMK